MQFIEDVWDGMQAPGKAAESAGYQLGAYIGYHYWALILIIVALVIAVAFYRRQRRRLPRQSSR